MDEKVKTDEPKVLLTQGEDGKLKAIAGEQDGKLKTVNPTKENADQFMKIDTNGNALENFFKKLSAQFSHPSHTGVYAVSTSAADKVAAFFDKIISIDHTDKVLDPYRVKPDGQMQEQGLNCVIYPHLLAFWRLRHNLAARWSITQTLPKIVASVPQP